MGFAIIFVPDMSILSIFIPIDISQSIWYHFYIRKNHGDDSFAITKPFKTAKPFKTDVILLCSPDDDACTLLVYG